MYEKIKQKVRIGALAGLAAVATALPYNALASDKHEDSVDDLIEKVFLFCSSTGRHEKIENGTKYHIPGGWEGVEAHDGTDLYTFDGITYTDINPTGPSNGDVLRSEVRVYRNWPYGDLEQYTLIDHLESSSDIMVSGPCCGTAPKLMCSTKQEICVSENNCETFVPGETDVEVPYKTSPDKETTTLLSEDNHLKLRDKMTESVKRLISLVIKSGF